MIAAHKTGRQPWLRVILLGTGLILAPLAFAQPLVVINTNDAGAGSLRQAILDANANLGPDTINFDIPGVGPHVIAPVSALPTIDEAVLIDGYSQPGTAANSAELGSNAIIDIVIDGSLMDLAFSGLRVEGAGSEIRGLSIININTGPALHLLQGGGHVVRGNWLGIDPSGSAAGNRQGIFVASENCTIGAPGGGPPTLADRNLIGNSKVFAIQVLASQGTRIQNNFIGTDPSGTAPASNLGGINLLSEGVMVGGLDPLEGNRVAWSRRVGVAVQDGHGGLAFNNTIRGNSILNNGELGIDLGLDGVSENDGSPDADAGPNGLQNFPVLISAMNSAGAITVSGVLDSLPNTAFDIDFYSNGVRDSGPPDAAGLFHGEGEAFLGTTQVTTDGAGHADFNLVLPEAPVGAWISATATDPNGNTSEFSATIPVPGENCTVTNTDPSGPGSFDNCLDQLGTNGNNGSKVDSIGFNIPGGGSVPHDDGTSPFSPNLIIDFSTQPGYQAPGVDPCADDAIRPVIVNANPPDLDLFDGTIIIGIDLIGSVIVKAEARAVEITESRLAATLPGAGVFLDGDLSNITRSIFVPNMNFPSLAVVGNHNRISDSCAENGLGIFAAASGNTLIRLHVPGPPDTSALILGGTGNTISALRTSNTPPRNEGAGTGITIDLGDDGHTENDPLDDDAGPNGLQNHPVIESATTFGTGTEGAGQAQVQGVLDSAPDSEFRIEAYASATCAPNDYGPAERFLGFIDVTTDAAGHTGFILQTTEPVIIGEVVVASATASDGSTSELSACVVVEMGDPDLILTSGFE